ncbi:MAG: hypothetical protein IT429_18120 [Gemmataceae bacterium]|nr:hypothetical protein [Gemmataceae bacterium]
MKAEHRKELQTNALADRMGKALQRMKSRPNRSSILTVILVLLAVGAIAFFLFARSRARSKEAERWVEFDLGTRPEFGGGQVLTGLAKDFPDVTAGQAARFQLAWNQLWMEGIKDVMRHPSRAMAHIESAQKQYRELHDELKDNPILASEALYHVAVAEETLAAGGFGPQQLRPDLSAIEKRLEAALKLYKEVETTYPKSAHAQEARKRIEALGNPEKRRDVNEFYTHLSDQLRTREGLDRARRLQEEIERFQRQQELKKK